MHGTIPTLILSAPALPRTFRTFKSLKRAVNFIAKRPEFTNCKLRKVQYGTDPRDLRYVVNLYGQNPRPARVKLAPKKVYVCSLRTELVHIPR